MSIFTRIRDSIMGCFGGGVNASAEAAAPAATALGVGGQRPATASAPVLTIEERLKIVATKGNKLNEKFAELKKQQGILGPNHDAVKDLARSFLVQLGEAEKQRGIAGLSKRAMIEGAARPASQKSPTLVRTAQSALVGAGAILSEGHGSEPRLTGNLHALNAQFDKLDKVSQRVGDAMDRVGGTTTQAPAAEQLVSLAAARAAAELSDELPMPPTYKPGGNSR